MIQAMAYPADTIDAPLATLGAALVLVSWWKPLLVLAPFLAWAWVISTIYDKDAARWYFKREAWNTAHLLAGAAALGVVFFAPPLLGPLTFWVAWPVMLAVLGADLAAYFVLRNRDDRVPEGARWTLNVGEMLAARADKKSKAKRGLGAVTLVFRGPDGEVEPPEKDSPEFELRVKLEELVRKVLDSRAARMDILPAKEGVYAATMTVDGVRTVIAQMPVAPASAMIDFLKGAAGLDVSDKRRKQRGEMQVGQAAASTITIGVSTLGASAGMRLTLLVNPVEQVSLRFDDLGLLPNQAADLRRLIETPGGVVLVAAPPGGGRTATLYALLREHDAYISNVQTVEMEPQAVIEGVRHNVFDPQVDGAEYSTTVRSILRRDPDVVGVAESDEATAREVAKADTERTRVYLSLPADSPLAAIQLYARLVGDQKAAAKSLKGVIAQRLVRRLCANCKIGVQPTPEMLKKLGLPASTKQLYRKSGKVLIKDKEQECPVCAGVGYFGQLGVFSVVTIGPAEQKLIAANDLTGLRAATRERKQQSVQQAALTHAISGDTSIEEVVRITQQNKPDAGAKARPASATPPAPAAG